MDEQELKKITDKVKRRITNYQGSDALRRAKECAAYYATDNPDIMGRTKVYAVPEIAADGTTRAMVTENRFAANERIASSLFRDITDSKVQYIAGEGADITARKEQDAEAVATILDALDVDKLRRVEQEALTDALVYGRGYVFMQVIEGSITLHYVPYCEVIPKRDKYGKMEAVTRYYMRDRKEYVEVHTAETVKYFERDKDDKNFRGWRFVEELPQIITVRQYGDGSREVIAGKGWSRLPWFEMRASNDGRSSLTNAVKTMIRAYDIANSDFANNLIDIQDVFVALKDTYGSGLEYGEVLENLRTYKASESVDSIQTVDIPYQARQVLLDRLERGIYAALRGVDVGRISSGNLTNTAIRALYSDIDLWADQAEWHLTDWVLDIMNLAADYMGIELPPVKVSFTRSAIFDDVPTMDALARQKGIISDKTLFEAHPLVDDAQAELERVAAEELDAAYSAGI